MNKFKSVRGKSFEHDNSLIVVYDTQPFSLSARSLISLLGNLVSEEVDKRVFNSVESSLAFLYSLSCFDIYYE